MDCKHIVKVNLVEHPDGGYYNDPQIDWCKENNIERFRIKHETENDWQNRYFHLGDDTPPWIIYRFESKEDAILFGLRWA